MMKRSNKKIICIIQARTSSERLPRKILADINGKKCIDRVIERVKKSELIDELWLATTKLRADDVLEDVAKKKKLNLFRGSTNNVLSRYYKIAKKSNADIIVRITGDCPLVDYKLINKGIKLFEDYKFDYVSNTIERTYPDGLDVEVFSIKTLEKTYKAAKHPFFLEHVTPYMHGKIKKKLIHGNFKIGQFLNSTNHSELRLTLDEECDLKLLNIIFKNINDFSSWKEAVNFMEKNTKLININKHIQLNEGSVISYKKYEKKMIDRYKNSKKLFRKAVKFIPTGSQTFSKSYMQWPYNVSPMFLKEGKGCIVKDVDNNTYIDYLLALMPIILGYANREVDNSVIKQIKKGTILSLSHPFEVELSEKLVNIIPYAQMVKFSKNGSDVLSAAIRLARAYTNRDFVAVSGYHGWHDWYIGTTSRNFGIPKETMKLTKKFISNDIESLNKLLGKNPEKFAAIVVEPESFEEANVSYLKEVRRICNKFGIILVFDEVICGFRTEFGGASRKFGIHADLGCFGKAMANGYPLAALVGKSKIMKKLDDVFVSGTFSGEILSIVACLKTLDILERDDTIKNLSCLGKSLKVKLNDIIEKNNLLDQFSFEGSDWWPRLNVKKTKIDKLLFSTLLRQEFLSKGLFIGASLNLCQSHNENKIQKKTSSLFEKSIKSFKFKTEDKNPKKHLKGKKIQTIFKIR